MRICAGAGRTLRDAAGGGLHFALLSANILHYRCVLSSLHLVLYSSNLPMRGYLSCFNVFGCLAFSTVHATLILPCLPGFLLLCRSLSSLGAYTPLS